MRFFCIGDEETARGFRLAGVTAVAVATEAEAEAAVEDALGLPDCGIILITERVASWIRPRLETIRLERARPLVVEMTGPEGPLPGRKSLREFVAEAVGVNVG